MSTGDACFILRREHIEMLHRGRVIEALVEEVAERGYATATARDIATRAGMSTRTFYDLYDDKQAAFFEMHRRLQGRAEKCLESARPVSGQPAPTARAALASLLDLVGRFPKHGRAFFDDGPVAAAAPSGAPLYLAAIGRWVSAARASVGTSSEVDIQQCASAVAGVVSMSLRVGAAVRCCQSTIELLVFGRRLPDGVSGSLATSATSASLPLSWDSVVEAALDRDEVALADLRRRAQEAAEAPEADPGATRLADAAAAARYGGLSAMAAVLGHGVKRGNLSGRALECLRYIAANPASSGRSVMRGLGLRQEAQVARLLGGLEQRGLIASPHVVGAARAWVITAQGRAALQQRLGPET